MKILADKTKQKEEMEAELKAYQDQDPEVIESIKQQTQLAHEAANRWTGKNQWYSFQSPDLSSILDCIKYEQGL